MGVLDSVARRLAAAVGSFPRLASLRFPGRGCRRPWRSRLPEPRVRRKSDSSGPSPPRKGWEPALCHADGQLCRTRGSDRHPFRTDRTLGDDARSIHRPEFPLAERSDSAPQMVLGEPRSHALSEDNISIRDITTLGLEPAIGEPDSAEDDEIPLQPTLHPSPIRSSAALSFATSRPGPLRVEILDLAGRLVRRPMDEVDAPPGPHVVMIGRAIDEGRRWSPGVYSTASRRPKG